MVQQFDRLWTIREIMPEVKEESEVAASFLSGGVDSSYVLAMSDVKESAACGYEAAGLEIRMPLTDRRIFDIASRMPSKYKVNEEQNKVAFRTAATNVLPEEIAFRKKLGFIVPIRIRMADERYNQDVQRLFR